jgi:hypothetical protein
MRHRALMLALLGILCLWASWAPGVRPAALLAAAINVVGFLGLYALYAILSAPYAPSPSPTWSRSRRLPSRRGRPLPKAARPCALAPQADGGSQQLIDARLPAFTTGS